MSSAIFREPLPLEEGIYRAPVARLRLPPAQRSNFWPPTATLYERLWRGRSVGLLSLGAFSTARELALMQEWTRPRAGEVFLDAACASGLYARTLKDAQPELTVHALDFSLSMLKQAQKLMTREIVLVRGDVTALPYRDAVFDTVVCGGSPNEFLDLQAALGEFARVLKPAGCLWLMYLAKAKGFVPRGIQRTLALSGLRFLAPSKVGHTANEAGLKLERADYRGIVSMARYRKAAYNGS